MKIGNDLSDSGPGPDSFSYEAKRLLTSIADAQILYFAEHNKWAGYPDNKGIFETLGWSPGGSHHYAYYCGNDYIAPKTGAFKFDYPDPILEWPYGVYPEVTLSDFTCMAIGNNDRDSFPDVWIINKFGRPAHVIDDAANKILVDIVSEPFDTQTYYANAKDIKEGKRVSSVYIEINLPAYRLDLHAHGRRLKSYPIAIGMRGFKTPLRTFMMERIEWHPWWIPPNASWCKEKDEEGKEIGCKPVSPGAWNPLGPVKMVLGFSYLIHGTNKPHSIGKRSSHGCIRMYSDDATDLAWKLMALAGTKQPLAKWELYKAKSRKTYVVHLLTPVQVNTVYKRMEIFNNTLLLHPDTYNWQPLTPERVKKKMIEFGFTLKFVNEESRGVLYRVNPGKTIQVPIRL